MRKAIERELGEYYWRCDETRRDEMDALKWRSLMWMLKVSGAWLFICWATGCDPSAWMLLPLAFAGRRAMSKTLETTQC